MIKTAHSLLLFQALLLAVPLSIGTAMAAGTAYGVIEGRPAAVARRACIGGESRGDLCNDNGDCPGSTCFDRNIFNLSVAVLFDASDAELATIENMVSDGSAWLYDVTDGQAEIGQATIHNNAVSTMPADVWVQSSPNICKSGTSIGSACAVHDDCPPNPPDPAPGACDFGAWWNALAGGWKAGGHIEVSIANIPRVDRPGESFAHEFMHLVFDAKDEYEARPGCLGGTADDSCPVATCTSGTSIGNHCSSDDDCPPNDPDPAPGTCATVAAQVSSLMSVRAFGPRSELCWGQGDPANISDMSGGNHDGDNTTEQSQCRSNRSLWDQVVWSWPNVFQKPAGAPDPGAPGVVNPTRFVRTSDVRRIALVLDESGSMDEESPSRMERLKVAALEFVELAEPGTELGIVSYSDDANASSGRANEPISALGANRLNWTDAIRGLAPDNMTNIGAGLRKARDMITAAGGVTANTYVVLMTDGLNNRPAPQATADADLQTAVADLSADGVPVYVTCTGSDRGLESQCAEIAAGTGGQYVDSEDSAALPDAFVMFHERGAGYEQILSTTGLLSKAKPTSVFVEQGSEAVSFVLAWDKKNASAGMTVKHKDTDTAYDSLPMTQGRYVRIDNPLSGEWVVDISVGGDVFVESKYVFSAFSFNRVMGLSAGVAQPTVKPGEGIQVVALPRSLEGVVSHPTKGIWARVIRPDGSEDSLELHDRGRDNTGRGDDVPQDGTFTGIYENTQLKGAYTFVISSDIEGWKTPRDARIDFRSREMLPEPVPSPRFVRQFVVSAAVATPGDVEPYPEDGRGKMPPWWDDFGNLLALLLLLGLILALLVIWYCCWRPKPVRKLANLAPLPDPRPGIGFCRLVESGPLQGRLKVAVINYGEADAPASTTTVTFSTGDAVDLATPPIRAGESVELEPVQLPKGCYAPDCHFRIVVDSRNEVTESDKGNNVAEYFCLG